MATNNVSRRWREFDSDRLFISGFHTSAYHGDVRRFFHENYGPVTNVHMLRDKRTGVQTGKCFVTFHSARVTDEVLRLAGSPPSILYNGCLLRVTRAYKRQPEVEGLWHNNAYEWQSMPKYGYNRSRFLGIEVKPSHRNTKRQSELVQIDESKCINSHLPSHCLIKVFKCLNIENQLKCRRVCRYWCYDLVPSAMIKTVEISTPNIVSKQFMNGYILSSAPGVKNILSLCPQLQILDLRAPDFTSALMKDQVKDNLITAIKLHCQQLKVLRLPPVLFFSSHQFKRLAYHLPNIEELSAVDNEIVNDSLLILFQHSPKLRYLDIRENRDLTSDAFLDIPPLRHLERLDISECELMDSHVFINLLESSCHHSLTHLSALDSIGPSLIMPEGVEALAQFTNLEYINLMEEDGSDTGDAGPICVRESDSLKALRALHNLRTLNIGGTICVHDGDVAAFVQGCPLLGELNICGSRYSKLNCLTANGLTMLRHARSLTKLDLSYITNVNQDVMEALCNLPRLQVLCIKDCPSLSAPALRLLVGSKLTELDISYNMQLEGEPSLQVLREFVTAERAAPATSLDLHFNLSGMSKAYLALGEAARAEYVSAAAAGSAAAGGGEVRLHYQEIPYCDEPHLPIEWLPMFDGMDHFHDLQHMFQVGGGMFDDYDEFISDDDDDYELYGDFDPDDAFVLYNHDL